MINKLKRRLKADEQLYGTWITVESLSGNVGLPP